MEGVITKALSGFYYVHCGHTEYTCRARGLFRQKGLVPLVGDRVIIETDEQANGTVTEILPRKNYLNRPAVANIDLLVIVVSAAIPITDPYLIDRVTVRCEKIGCNALIVINKYDLDPGDNLFAIYSTTPYSVVRASAATGCGVDALRQAISGKICCFTGNSGVGKSSLLNALNPHFSIRTAEVSEKLGRGKHTTRHVEFFNLGNGCYVADTPGFASFDGEDSDPIRKNELASLFPEFTAYTNQCRFPDCAHLAEPGCQVRNAVDAHVISSSRYASYKRLHEEISQYKDWKLK